jgi:putative colanic acid biosynthesis acetyltransferase WcaF
MKTDLSQYNNAWYQPGNKIKRVLWYCVSLFFFQNYLFPFSAVKVFLLRLFGAKVGKGVVLKPNISIKYPWMLKLGNNIWIGEQVWIDNLAPVVIGDNVCLSQGALLLTGNHNYSEPNFDLIVKPIILSEGVWIGAKAVVCPGIECGSHSVLAVGSIATKNMDNYFIYQGNPAVKIKQRIISPISVKS